MSNALAKITRRAKQIRKKHPGMKYTSCVKKAGAEYRAGKLGATLLIEKKETKKTKPKRVVRVTRNSTGTFKKMQTVGAAKSTLRDHFKNQLQNALFSRDQAKNKRLRKKAGKRVAEARKNFNKFS